MLNLVIIALGGAFGSMARYLVGLWVKALAPQSEWPWATLIANLAGGLLMGVLMGLIWGPFKAPVGAERLRLGLGVGVLGGFTTFSTFSLELVVMLERKAYGAALAYGLISVLGAVGGLWLGLGLIRRIAV